MRETIDVVEQLMVAAAVTVGAAAAFGMFVAAAAAVSLLVGWVAVVEAVPSGVEMLTPGGDPIPFSRGG